MAVGDVSKNLWRLLNKTMVKNLVVRDKHFIFVSQFRKLQFYYVKHNSLMNLVTVFQNAWFMDHKSRPLGDTSPNEAHSCNKASWKCEWDPDFPSLDNGKETYNLKGYTGF